MEHDHINARAQRVTDIVNANHGNILSSDGNIMMIEVPADIAPGLGAIWGEGGFSRIFAGQRRRISHCRVIDMNGYTIVRHQMVATAFYRYTIDLVVDTRSDISRYNSETTTAKTMALQTAMPTITLNSLF
jgi:hypothetical protein